MYTLIVRKSGGRVPSHVLSLTDREDLADLPFEPESHLRWSSDTGDVIFAGWQTATRVFGVGSYWHLDAENRLTAFSGRLLPSAQSWATDRSWAEQLAELLAHRPLDEPAESLRGIFTAVSLTSDGRGALITDPLGLGIVYRAETSDFTVFSNRAALAARMIGPAGRDPARDPLGVGWLVHSGFIVGDATGFEGVRAVPQGSWIDLPPQGEPVIRERSRAPWRFSDDELELDPKELASLVREDITAALRAMVETPASSLTRTSP